MLPSITARDFVRRELVTLSPRLPAIDGIYQLIRNNISGAPVVADDGAYLGVFSEKCCFHALEQMVDQASGVGEHLPHVHEFMNRKVITIDPQMEVFDAIDYLLSSRISGAPVIDRNRNYLGVFSEKTAMQVVITAIYDQVPGSEIARFMDVDRNRLLDPDTNLQDAMRIFLQTPYRRLPVLDGDRLIGQVSRRDVLRAQYRMASSATDKIKAAQRSAMPDHTPARKESANCDAGLAEFRMDPTAWGAVGSHEAMDSIREGSPAIARCGTDQRMVDKTISSGTVGEFMDVHALTKNPDVDLLGIAEAFLSSPYRRLPILQDGKLIGQISRRDLLAEALKLLRPKSSGSGVRLLYLSSVSDGPPPGLV